MTTDPNLYLWIALVLSLCMLALCSVLLVREIKKSGKEK